MFRKFDQWAQAMHVALRLNDLPTIIEVFVSCTEKGVRRQLAHLLARQQVWLDLESLLEDSVDEEEIEVLLSIASNVCCGPFLCVYLFILPTFFKTPLFFFFFHHGRAS